MQFISISKKNFKDYKNKKKCKEELIYELAEKGIKRAAIAKRLGLKIPAVDYAIHKKNRLRAK